MGKKERTRQLLIDTAISLFLKKRSANVSLDEIADTAGVARRTLFYHFDNKETLVLEVAAPIFKDGITYLKGIVDNASIEFQDIVDLCLFLWRIYGSRLNLLYSIDFEDFNRLKKLHFEYLELYLAVCGRISDLPEGLQPVKMDIAAIIFRCFVPILSKTTGMDRGEERFKQSLRGLVYGLDLV